MSLSFSTSFRSSGGLIHPQDAVLQKYLHSYMLRFFPVKPLQVSSQNIIHPSSHRMGLDFAHVDSETQSKSCVARLFFFCTIDYDLCSNFIWIWSTK